MRLETMPNKRERYLSYAGALIAALSMAISVNAGGFVAGGTDSSGYISAGALWSNGDLYRPEPLHFWATWKNASESASPVAYRPGPIPGTEVSIYPLGFPLLCAAASSLVGSFGGYLVAPIMGGVLAWCAFMLARDLAGSLAGLLAAALVASSPVVLLHTVHPMSDVPAAACWLLAWLLALRGTVGAAVAAGLAASMAILIRPNLAPLAVVPAAVVLWNASHLGTLRTWGWRETSIFVAAAAVGPALVAWSQAVLYGSAFLPGYVEWESFYRSARVGPNLLMYTRLLSTTHTLLPLLGLVLVPMAFLSTRVLATRESCMIAVSAAAMFGINVALYLPYLSIDHWPMLRFLLPGLTGLFILFAGLLAVMTGAIWRSRARWAAVIVPVAAAFVVLRAVPMIEYSLRDWSVQARIRLMGHYLREALPPNAIVLGFMHSGEVAHYTAREVLRMDVIDPPALDSVVEDLRRHGYRPVFVLDDSYEIGPFRQVFAASRYGRLDWTPRAVFTSVASISYFDLADAEPYAKGERWPTDVVR